jgi:hypothetical protein
MLRHGLLLAICLSGCQERSNGARAPNSLSPRRQGIVAYINKALPELKTDTNYTLLAMRPLERDDDIAIEVSGDIGSRGNYEM